MAFKGDKELDGTAAGSIAQPTAVIREEDPHANLRAQEDTDFRSDLPLWRSSARAIFRAGDPPRLRSSAAAIFHAAYPSRGFAR